MAIALSVWGCHSPSADSVEITRAECENDSAFIFIPSGEFIKGSDIQERDFAYNISARAIADTPQGITQAEQELRKIGWFDREPSRQTASVSSFCLARNLVTNQEYKEFIEATNYRIPNITEAEYQQQAFVAQPIGILAQLILGTFYLALG